MTVESVTYNRITSPRNLINVGVFTAVYFVVLFAGGMLGILNPVMVLLGALAGTVVNAMVCMLYVAKTRALGAYTLLGLVIGLLMVATGHAWVTPILSTGLGLLADLITRAGGYTRTSTNALGFAVFSVWCVGPVLPVLWGSEEYFADMARRMGQDYADAMRALFSPAVIVGWSVIMSFVACGGGLIGRFLLRKHFAKAGVA